eukprot:XP_001696714.1 predicted protein [Chlamydomonas reinhardtii]
MGFGAGAMGGYGGMGGVGGVLRPTSLQDHLTGGLGAGGMAPDPSQWRPALGVVPSATGMQGFATPGSGQFGEGMGCYGDSGAQSMFNTGLAIQAHAQHVPIPVGGIMRPASDSLLVNQRASMGHMGLGLSGLGQNVEKLAGENESLRSMNGMLEKVLNLREEHISNLQEAAKLTAAMSELVHKVAMISPLAAKRLLATNMELHAMAAGPGTRFTAEAIRAMSAEDVIEAWKENLKELSRYVERVGLVNGLSQQAIPRSRVYADICASSLAAHEAADRLRANLQREHNINMEFVVFVFKGVLDLLQVATAAVHSYPYYPDVLAMANVLHAQQGGGTAGTAAGGAASTAGGSQVNTEAGPRTAEGEADSTDQTRAGQVLGQSAPQHTAVCCCRCRGAAREGVE